MTISCTRTIVLCGVN